VSRRRITIWVRQGRRRITISRENVGERVEFHYDTLLDVLQRVRGVAQIKVVKPS
jgi:hypothetical protein